MNTDFRVVNTMHVALLSIIGTALLSAFIMADLAILSEPLQDVYLTSRLLMQLPACFIFLLLTYIPSYAKIHQVSVCAVVLALVFSNYWLIAQCWILENVVFPYEATVIYILFALFVFRLSFIYAAILSAIALAGFALLIFYYPIYGELTLINLGFVAATMMAGLIGIFQIENGLKKLTKAHFQLISLSQIDPLTNIYNRDTYESKFTEQLEFNRRSGNTMCVYLVDLDNFKQYNDVYGHVQGDNILKLQAEMLSRVFRRATDVVARYDSDEFVVLTSNNTAQECERLAQQIVALWKSQKIPHTVSNDIAYMTCSIGYHFELIDAESDKDFLVEKAEKALYQAKGNGRNCFVQFQQNIA